MKHIEPLQIQRYAMGVTDITERILIETHLHHCEFCMDQVHRATHVLQPTSPFKETHVSQDILLSVMEEIDKLPNEPQFDSKFQSLFPAAIHPDIPSDSHWEWTTMWPSKGKSARILVDPISSHSLYCVQFDPGATTPEHHHLGKEETVILQGGYSYGSESITVGDYDVASVGTQHAPVIHQGQDCWCLVRISSQNSLKFVGKSVWRQPFYKLSQWLER